MARDQFEFESKGFLQDRYGRDQFVAVQKHQAPLPTDVSRGYEPTDPDGRRQVVVLSGATGRNLLDIEADIGAIANLGDLSDVTTALNNLQGDLNNVTADVAALDTRMDNVEGDLAVTNSDVAAHGAAIATLQASQSSQDSAITALQTAVAELQALLIPDVPLTSKRFAPFGAYSPLDQAMRTVSLGNGAGTTFTEGSAGRVSAFRFVPQQDIVLDKWWHPIKAKGCAWWPASGSGYGLGNGGRLRLRIVECDQTTGLPRFTDTAAVVAQQPYNQTAGNQASVYEQVQSYFTGTVLPTVGGTWTGLDGPMLWPFSPRTPANGIATLKANTMYAVCVWNVDPNNGLNCFSVNPTATREYIWPARTPGLSGWSLPKSGGRAQAPNCFNNLDPNAPGAILGLSPRDCCFYSQDGGATWAVGKDAGHYTAASPPDSIDQISRVPWFAYTPQGGSIVSPHPYYNVGTPGSGANPVYTMTVAKTITHLGGHFPSGTAPGTITCVHKRGAATLGTYTASISDTAGGMQIEQLAASFAVQVGDTLTLSSTGAAHAHDHDANTAIAIPGLNTATFQRYLFALPHTHTP